MSRKAMQEVAPRTVRLHIPSYNSILEFFRMSPSGIRGSDAIRQVLLSFGNYCDDQMKAGRTASSQDLLEAENIVLKTFGNKDGRP